MGKIVQHGDGALYKPTRILDWIGLDWIGLVWIGLVWIGLVWIGLVWILLQIYPFECECICVCVYVKRKWLWAGKCELESMSVCVYLCLRGRVCVSMFVGNRYISKNKDNEKRSMI